MPLRPHFLVQLSVLYLPIYLRLVHVDCKYIKELTIIKYRLLNECSGKNMKKNEFFWGIGKESEYL